MSTASLPNYVQPTFSRTPSYTAEPQAHEQRIALAQRHLRPWPSGEFVKQSKSGDVSLRLIDQQNDLSLPVYGAGGSVEGTVNLSKCDGVTSVEVKIEGRLRLREIAEGGTMTSKLCLDTIVLWVKDRNNTGPCPGSIPFLLTLPTTFSVEGATYPLPPTYEAHLSGLPGFQASIDYSVSATVNKPNVPSFVKSTLFALNIGNTIVSTPFVYYPRTRPAVPMPSPMLRSNHGLVEAPEWRSFESLMTMKSRGNENIVCKLYLPASRIYCVTQPIPFYLMLKSSAVSLAAYLSFGPTASLLSPAKRPTRIQLLRQSAVDVRNSFVVHTKTDIWRVDSIGDGSFKRLADGPDWTVFSGEILINEDVKVGGFKAGGLTVKDCIVLSMSPLDPVKSPFNELRLVVPVCLTTNPFVPNNGTGVGADDGSIFSVPSTPDEEAQPGLPA